MREGPSHHQGNDPVCGEPLRGAGGHHPAILEDGDVVGDGQNLVEPVADVGDADAVGGKLAQHRQQPVRVAWS